MDKAIISAPKDSEIGASEHGDRVIISDPWQRHHERIAQIIQDMDLALEDITAPDDTADIAEVRTKLQDLINALKGVFE